MIKVTGIDTNTKPFYEYKTVLVDEYFYWVHFNFSLPSATDSPHLRMRRRATALRADIPLQEIRANAKS